jgi:hypothetical protein
MRNAMTTDAARRTGKKGKKDWQSRSRSLK